MDLWQKQVSSVVSDKQFIQSMLELFQSMQMPGYDGKSNTSATSKPVNAPDAGHELLAEFAYRLAMCEKRIAGLEKQLAAAKQKQAAPAIKTTIKKTKTAGSRTTAGSASKRAGRGSKKPRK